MKYDDESIGRMQLCVCCVCVCVCVHAHMCSQTDPLLLRLHKTSKCTCVQL